MSHVGDCLAHSHMTIGHVHAIEGLEGLEQMLHGVINAYSHPFHLSHNLIVPDHALVTEADWCLRRGVLLLKESVRRGSR